MAMRFRWMGALNRRDQMIGDAEDFEHGVADMVARWYYEWLEEEPLPKDFKAEIRFPGNPFPEDRRADQDSDMKKITAGLMTTAEFVIKWQLPNGATADDVAQYIEGLQADKQSRAPQQPPVGVPPLAFPEFEGGR